MIHQMIEELSQYKRPRDVIMMEAVQERLNTSYDVYVKELDNSLQFLSKRHELSIMKRLNKHDKTC